VVRSEPDDRTVDARRSDAFNPTAGTGNPTPGTGPAESTAPTTGTRSVDDASDVAPPAPTDS